MTIRVLTRTSDSHPLCIDSVRPARGWGLIGLSFCPGKKELSDQTGHWHRDLSKDLERIREWGATMVISLIEAHEFEELQVKGLPAMLAQLDMTWRHLPIRHCYPPGMQFEARGADTRKEVIARLKAGQRIFIHGKGGLGRTGTVAACLLIESGVLPEDAITRGPGGTPKYD